MSKRVIQAVANNKKLMPCFNVPFQSGDNEVLQLMRRGYTRERYLDIIKSIREIMPDAAITTDCIVGFPGETEEQFQNTLSLLNEVFILFFLIYILLFFTVIFFLVVCITYFNKNYFVVGIMFFSKFKLIFLCFCFVVFLQDL
jgi:radical SAM superfamily enzyme YgiQ (UPF0313 family)